MKTPSSSTAFIPAGSFTTPLLRNPDCPIDHCPWQFETTGQALQETSLEQLAEMVGQPISEADSPLFHVHGFEWVENLVCRAGHIHPHRRFIRQGEAPGPFPVCGICGESASPELVTRRRAISATSLGACLSTPLDQLGIDAANRIDIRTSASMTLIQFRPASQPNQ